MDERSDEQILIMKSIIESTRQDSDDEMKNLTEDLIAMTASIMDRIKSSKYSPENKYSPKAQGTITVVPANKKDLPLEGVNDTKIGGMGTLKHEIISPTFYEILIKT